MSATSDATTYTIGISDEMGHCDGSINFSYTGTDPVVTDDFVLGLAQTLKNYPWPSGMVVQVNANKSVNHSTAFSGDVTADPPIFQ